MANPLKVLTALSASSGVAVSGSDGLKVQQGGLIVSSGVTSVGALTASSAELTTVDINGGTIDGVSIGATTQAAGKFTTISGSSTLDVGGAATIAGQLTVQGGMVVNGTLTTVDTTNLQIKDAKIIIASGSTTESQIDNAGIYFGGTDQDGGGAVASITYNSASSGEQTIKLSDALELPTNGAIYADLANASSYVVATTAGAQVGGGMVFTGSILASAYHGPNNNQSIQLGEVSSSGGGVVELVKVEQGSSYIQLTNGDITFGNSTTTKTLTELAAGASSVSKTDYYSIRSAVTSSHSGNDISILFSGSNDFGSDGNNRYFKAITALTSSTGTGLLELLSYASFDVAVQAADSNNWTNDLVSVTLTSSNSSSESGVTANYHFPKFIISAPSLTAGAKVRLIVVNEKKDVLA